MDDVESRELDPIRGDFSRVRQHLKLRLYPAASGADGAVVAAPVAPGLQAVLVFDLPSAIAPVRPADLRSWQQPAEELIALALENVRTQEQVRVEPLDLGGARVFSVSGASMFVATLAMSVDELLGATANGALVAMPSSHIVLCHAVQGPQSRPVLQAMIATAAKICAEGPHGLSPHVYHRRGDKLEPVTELQL
jgi:hypothetical protein